MKVKAAITLFLLIVFCFVSAQTVAAEQGTTKEKIQEGYDTFDPDKVGKNLEKKGNELLGIARSGSKFYIAFVLVVFVFLLIVSIFYHKLVKVAFFVLFMGIVGFVLVNYWPEIVQIAKSIGAWFMDNPETEGGQLSETTSGI